MPPLLKRILTNGLLTAATLAAVGYGYAELAGLFLTTQTPNRATLEAPMAPPAEADPVAESLQSNVPMMMALWGFAFVAIGELVLHRRKPQRSVVASPEPKPDTAEVLLEQILAKVEAERAAPAEPASSPSTAPTENSPVAP